MATDTFSWCVRIGAEEEVTVATLQAQFGDNYKQVAGVGINQDAESWNLSCNGKIADMATVRAFLKSHVTSSFWWVNPWGEKKLYRVKNDSIKPSFQNGIIADIAFTFEQSFAP
ncbi:MAG: phage tail protein [Pantoea sp.]|uniref:phage tail protein n=1 Tax=Pantoea sp. TaxID=69393 RepID=UPI0023A0C95E|nr:phage tail protein [Pantoea sp.]MDE1188191.1 phage tail protein [Pantoea sp.]